MPKGVYGILKGQTIQCKYCGKDTPRGHPRKRYCSGHCLNLACMARKVVAQGKVRVVVKMEMEE